jgi:hypothetical protein
MRVLGRLRCAKPVAQDIRRFIANDVPRESVYGGEGR